MNRILTLVTLLVGIIIGAHFASSVHAQTAVPFAFATTSATHAACPAVVTGTSQYCFAADGFWQSIAGAAYAQLGAAVTGVTSFNGRTGAVTSASGDYSYSQLSAQPTSLSCPQASLSTTGLTSGASGSLTGTCSFK